MNGKQFVIVLDEMQAELLLEAIDELDRQLEKDQRMLGLEEEAGQAVIVARQKINAIGDVIRLAMQ